MKPARFDYLRAGHIEEATAALAQYGADARILAGGQSLVAMLNMRLAQPAALVDIMQVPDLQAIRLENGKIVIPAALRQAQLTDWPELARTLPLLDRVMPWVGHVQTRARGTICGSVAHADPSAEIPLTMLVLDAEIDLRSAKRRRSVAARDFFLGTMLTDKADSELVEAVRIPLGVPQAGTAFRERGRRKGDFAIVACAAIVAGSRIRLGVGGVNDTPVLRDWDSLDPADLADALNDFAWSLDARSDLHASARYRRDLVRHLGRQAIEEARECAA